MFYNLSIDEIWTIAAAPVSYVNKKEVRVKGKTKKLKKIKKEKYHD